MTAGEISTQVITRIDDDPANPVSVSAAEILGYVNEGQELASLLTLFLERTAPYTLAGCWHTPRPAATDYLVPLQLTVLNNRLRPATLRELDSLDPLWQAAAGTPTRYVALGFNLLAVTPQANVTAQFTYAAAPAPMAAADTPQLPAPYHADLVEYGLYRARLKEGAQQLERGMLNLNHYLDAMTRLGDRVRARSRAASYDTLPFELALFDRSRLVDQINLRNKTRGG